ncbi:bifunctional phosphopantothenoylcysteine decarboxylase/phosphopantothenate--cysteine ligase CoaBC [Amaricoccus macauensis]|uniref:bifunctional phosphopantothenoylcysteine decarboxylase/phosphopantothenate--cysteine ligase CoaBC n=1 Tax=Amaricoccus macauensis TaxID=57001 RepID=UPI003C79D521
MLVGKKILLVIGGGIAAYKSLELIRLLQKAGASVVPVLTRSGAEFVTPLSVSALAGQKVHAELFDLTAEAEMGHIELSRSADLVVVAPATADLMAKLAGGLANDLASTLLLATDKRVLMAPAMNVRMWEHPATARNLETLQGFGVLTVGPDAGEMACGEFGPGRMAEPARIVEAIDATLGSGDLAGRHVLVTSGPTHEPIDPVRYIANRSSGRQGSAIAEALVRRGARVSFITGPASAPKPLGCAVIEVETAREMLAAVEAALPADAAIFAAAVADWHVKAETRSKIKKKGGETPPPIELAENPDILKTISHKPEDRPSLVVGFAAETDDVIANATAKRQRKGCDWLIANDVRPETGIMGGKNTTVTLITQDGPEAWEPMSKTAMADRLASRIAEALS